LRPAADSHIMPLAGSKPGGPPLALLRHGVLSMKKLLVALALTGLFVAGTFTAIAQAPKPTAAKPADPKPADPKVDPKKPADPKDDPKASKGTITIKPDAKGRYRLLIKDADGKGILMTAGNGFETEKEARAALEEIKGILATGKVTVEKADDKEKDK